MAEERPHSTWRDDTLADKKSETRYPTEAKGKNAFSSLQISPLSHPTESLKM